MRLSAPFYESYERVLLQKKKRGQKYTVQAVEDPARLLGGAEMGEEWTRQLIANQAFFAKKYGANPEMSAAWLVAMAGAMVDGASSRALFEQASGMGLPDEEVLRIGIALDSPSAASFLVSRGADFSGMFILPNMAEDLHRQTDVNMPSRHFVDPMVDPNYQDRKNKVQLSSAIDMLSKPKEFRAPERFIDEIIKSGVDVGVRIDTRALGLADGKASWASIAIAHGNVKLAARLLDAAPTLSQDLLDEALLAVAMVSRSADLYQDDRKALGNLAQSLAKRGANPDRVYAMNDAAYADLRGWSYRGDETALDTTARQWAVSAHVRGRGVDKKLLSAIVPSPWPALPGDESWVAFVVNQASFSSGDEKNIKQMLDRAFSTMAKKEFLDVEEGHRELWMGRALRKENGWLVMDALLDSAVMKKAVGQYDPEMVWEMARQLGEVGALEEMKPDHMEGKVNNFWGHERFKRLMSWAPEDNAKILVERVEAFTRQAESLSGGDSLRSLTARDMEALKMTLTSCFNRPSVDHVSPKPPRRTL